VDILAGVRVIDFSTGIAGPYATKLVSDAGAEVVRVEPESGDPLRRRFPGRAVAPGGDSALFRFLTAGKPAGSIDDELLADADAVVLGDPVTASRVAELRQQHPRLVVVTVTSWGLRGPWVGRPATEFTVQAESGVIANHGRPEEVPYQTGGRLIEWCTGVTAAVGLLGALVGQRGVGRHVDVSMQAVAAHTGIAFVDVRDRVEGSSVGKRPPRIIDAPSIEPTADGFVGFAAHSPAQIRAFLKLVEREDLLGSDWERLDYRLAHLDVWNEMVREWTRTQQSAAVVAAAARLRIPVAPVVGPEGLFAHPQVVGRGLIDAAPDGGLRQPVGPYLIDGVRPTPRKSPTGAVRRPPPCPAAADRAQRPLAGIRVLDCTSVFAGPSAAQVLCYLGAEVIHLESGERIDSGRAIVGPLLGAEAWWEQAGMFLSNNRDKLSLAVSLGSDQGRQVISRLIERCDVVLENFSPRVFERFGFDHDAVRAINPRAVFARMPAFGLSGPWRDHLGFAQTMEQVTGMAWRTGCPDQPPRVPRGPCDPLAGYHAAFAVLLGLIRREVTGLGAAVEVPMLDVALNAAAELIVEFSDSAVVLNREGNRTWDAAPQGVYPCRGEERWLALSIVDDEQWAALRAITGWPDDDELRTPAGRRACHDELDKRLEEWSRGEDLDAAVSELVAVGIPAGAVQDPRLLSFHPQLRGFGYYEESDHPIVGRQQIPALPFRYDDVDRWSTGRAPLFGEHNTQILGGLLRLSEDQLDELERTAVTATRPAVT
jgi:crotonobetainyl-CoA:carnitine CoA-transferase CaiB-like acyl-CoA transferase